MQVGQIVSLISGGPNMTVAALGTSVKGGLNNVQCYWYDDHNALEMQWFPIATLNPTGVFGKKAS